MNRLVRTTCAALFAGTTTCSLILSASSTMAKATAVHVPPAIVWSAVGVLELVSLAGTLRWLTATTARGRAHAIVVVVLAALVTAQAGWSAYGWWGAIAPVAVVVTIHMISETLGDDDQAPVYQVVETTEPLVEPIWGDETKVEVQPEPVRPQLESVGWSVNQIVADLRERGATDLNQRGIRRHYSVGAGKANKVLAELAPNEVAS